MKESTRRWWLSREGARLGDEVIFSFAEKGREYRGVIKGIWRPRNGDPMHNVVFDILGDDGDRHRNVHCDGVRLWCDSGQ